MYQPGETVTLKPEEDTSLKGEGANFGEASRNSLQKVKAKIKDIILNPTGDFFKDGHQSFVTGKNTRKVQQLLNYVNNDLKQYAVPHPYFAGVMIVSPTKLDIKREVPPRQSGANLVTDLRLVLNWDFNNREYKGINQKKLDAFIEENAYRLEDGHYGWFSMGRVVLQDNLRNQLQQKLSEKGYNAQYNPQTNSFKVTKKDGPKFARQLSQADTAYLQRALKLLRKLFPNVETVTDINEYDDAVDILSDQGHDVSNVKGFFYEGKVYIDPRRANPETAFHEFAHVWVAAVRQGNPALFEAAKKALVGTEFVDHVKSIDEYVNSLQGDEFWEEVLVTALGQKANEIFQTQEQQAKWKRIVDRITNWLKRKLNIKSNKPYSQMKLNEILDIGTDALLYGPETEIEVTEQDVQFARASRPDYALNYVWGSARKIVQTREFGKEKAPQGWSQDPYYRDLIEKQYPASLAAHEAKHGVGVDKPGTAPKTEGQVKTEARRDARNEARREGDQIDYSKIPNAPLQEVIGFLDAWKSNNPNKNQQYLRPFFEGDTGQAAIGAIKAIVQQVDERPSWVQLAGAMGKFALRKKPEGMEQREFRIAQYKSGAVIMEVMLENGFVDLEYNYRSEMYEVVITDENFLDNFSDAIAELPNDPNDYTEVFEDAPPPDWDAMINENGADLISRYHKLQEMSPEEYPLVYDVANKAGKVGYGVDVSQLEFLKLFNELGLFDPKDQITDYDRQTLSEWQLKQKEKRIKEKQKAKKREIRTLFKKAGKLGDKAFYIQHNFDYRGRLYALAHGLTFQGPKMGLSLFTFDTKDPIGEGGYKALEQNAADYFGWTGANDFATREKFVQENKAEWYKWVADPKKYAAEIMATDEPTLFFRAVNELKRADAHPEGKFNYPSGLPVHRDATTSGLQILAAMSRDIEAAKLVNISDTQERYDSYTAVAQEVYKLLPKAFPKKWTESITKVQEYENAYKAKVQKAKETTTNQEELKKKMKKLQNERKAWRAKNKGIREEAARAFWAGEGVRKKMRKIAKGPVMTKYYSSGVQGIADALYNEFSSDPTFEGLNRDNATFMAQWLFDAADSKFDGPGRVMKALKQLGTHVAKNQDRAMTWHAGAKGGSNFKVVQDPKKSTNIKLQMVYKGKNEYILKNKNPKVSTSIAVDTDQRDSGKAGNQSAPNVVHSLDAQLVHYVMLNADFPVQTIHDSFATNPANTAKLDALIREGFAELLGSEENVVGMLTEMNGGNVEAAQKDYQSFLIGGFDPKEVLKNPHAFSAGVTDPALSEVADQNQDTGTNQNEVKAATKLEADIIADSISAQAAETQENSKPCK